jgi:hypothetical protein
MSRFFQSEIAARGGKHAFSNVKFKKGNFESSAPAEAGTLLELIPVHIKNPPVIQFVAYLDTMSDTFSSQHTPTQPFGRTNPYYIWRSSKRSIRVSWSLPSSGQSSALENLNNLSWFLSALYPSFKETDTATSISASPLFRVRYGNLISSPTSDGQGLLCVIQGVTVTHAIKEGFVAMTPTNGARSLIKAAGFESSVSPDKKLLVPKLIKLNCNLDVVHDHALGWDHHTGQWRGGLGARNYPYDFGLVRDTQDTPSAPPQSYEVGPAEPLPGSIEARQRAVAINDTTGAGVGTKPGETIDPAPPTTP